MIRMELSSARKLSVWIPRHSSLEQQSLPMSISDSKWILQARYALLLIASPSFKVDTGKTFQLYFTTLQSLGPAFPLDYMPPTEPLPASESGPVLQSSPIKRQASTVFSMNPSPKKKPILRTASMGLLSILPLTPLGSMSLTSAATSPAASIQEDMEVWLLCSLQLLPPLLPPISSIISTLLCYFSFTSQYSNPYFTHSLLF